MKQRSFGDRSFLIVNTIFLTLVFIIVLYPLVYVVSASFSSPQMVITGKIWLWPVEPTLMGYEAVFKNRQILSAFANSFFYMFVGTFVNLIMTLLAGYPLSRPHFFGKSFLNYYFIIPMFFSGGLVPLYLVIKDLGMINTRWALIIPTAMSVWNVILMRTFIQSSIPHEMYEAAQLDGCNEFKFLLRMILPLSAPILAVLGLYYGVGHWNSYFNALIYLKDQNLFPIQIILRNILVLNNIDPTMIQDFEALARKQGIADLLKYSCIVVASLPVLAIYPFVQRYFVKGVMVGALKG